MDPGWPSREPQNGHVRESTHFQVGVETLLSVGASVNGGGSTSPSDSALAAPEEKPEEAGDEGRSAQSLARCKRSFGCSIRRRRGTVHE